MGVTLNDLLTVRITIPNIKEVCRTHHIFAGLSLDAELSAQ